MKTNIAVFMEVFNEEDRIENCCEFFKWADELVIIDKSSTDRTVELARKYTDKVFVVPYANSSVVANHVLPGYKTNCEWFLFPTASSAIEPKLVQELIKLTTSKSFPFDVISLPLRMHVLGLASDYSPWGAKFKNICIRKTALILSTEVHKEIGYRGQNIYRQLLELDSFLYHFTHNQVDVLLERCGRYTNQESKVQHENGNIVLRTEFIALAKAFFYVAIKKRVFMIGWDGVALGIAYIIYFMMKFLYSWERIRGLNSETYSREINKIKKMWANNEN